MHLRHCIIDTHTHFYDPSRPQGVPCPPADNKLLYRTVLPEHYRMLAVPEGVAGTVVVEASDWLEDNQWILGLAAQDPFIVGLVGHIDPGQAEFGEHLWRFASNPLFRGVRCGARYFEDVSNSRFLADMETLVAGDLALDMLVRREHIEGLCQLARRVPELRIVVDHIAHMPIDGGRLDAAWTEAYQQMAARPHIYVKVSALMEQSVVQPVPEDADFYRPALDALWEAFGEDRLIYGSNWPVCERAGSFAQGIRIVKAYFVEKGEQAAEKCFWRNAKAVYKYVDRAGEQN
jgi:L-fuconolactonase